MLPKESGGPVGVQVQVARPQDMRGVTVCPVGAGTHRPPPPTNTRTTTATTNTRTALLSGSGDAPSGSASRWFHGHHLFLEKTAVE